MANDPNPRPLNPPWPANASDGSGDERGWSARAPTEIPPKGWRDVILRVFHGISEDHLRNRDLFRPARGVSRPCRSDLALRASRRQRYDQSTPQEPRRHST
jgi:hypothetical protein